MKATHPTPCLPTVDNRQAKSPPKPGRSPSQRWWWLPLLWLGGLMTPLAAQQFGDFTYSSDGAGVIIVHYTGAGGAVTIPDTIAGLPVRWIDYHAFRGKHAVTSVTIPDTVTWLGQGAFSGCADLLKIEVAAGNTAYGSVEGALFDNGLTTLIQYPLGKAGNYDIPHGIAFINDWAFAGCTGLTSVIIPDSATTIGYHAFSECSSLASVIIGDGVLSIEKGAFFGCMGLTSVAIPDSVRSIGVRAFDGCTGLLAITVAADNPVYGSVDGVLLDKNQTTLLRYPPGKAGGYTIPGGVTSIGWNAFSGCTALTSVVIPDGVTSVDYWMFAGCTSLSAIVAAADHPAFSSVEGVLFGKSRTTVLLHPMGKAGDYTIPDGVTVIGEGAFQGCTGLSSVNIPDTVTHIEDGAFAYCTGLTGVVIPGSVTRIDDDAFLGSANLISILFLGDAPVLDREAPPFAHTAPGFTVYRLEGRKGFTAPYRTVALTRFDSADDTLQVLGCHRDAGSFSLVTFGKAGRTYQLMRHPNLGAGQWTPVATADALTADRVLELTDPAAPPGQAFYRVVAVGP